MSATNPLIDSKAAAPKSIIAAFTMRVALLEDDADQAELMRLWLKEAGYACSHFDHSEAFLRDQKRNSYDLLILDWELPDINGLEVLRRVRKSEDWRVPVLFATQRDHEQNVVDALEAGADDYMTKPIRRNEMLARVNAVVRRTRDDRSGDEQSFEITPYGIDIDKRIVTLRTEEIKLNNKEFDLVLFLFSNVGRVISRDHLLESVWGTSPDVNTRTIDTHMSRIRNKLSLSPENGWRLTSVYRHGYRLEQLVDSD